MIIKLVFILILLLYIVVFLNHEKRKGVIWSSPFSMMVIGNLPVLILYGISADYLYYHSLRAETVLCILFGIFLFSLPAIIYMRSFKDNNKRIIYSDKRPIRSDWAINLSIIISIIMLLAVNSIGMENIANEEAASLYASNGIRGHLFVVQIFLMTHMLIHKSKRNVIRWIAVILGGVSIFFYQVKIWMFTPFIISLMAKVILYRYKVSITKILVASSIIFVLFVLSYMPTFGYELSEETQIFLFNHFTKYLFAGVSGLNEAFILNLPIGQNPISGLPPFILLFVSYQYKVHEGYEYLIINDLNEEYTNVFTLYGQQYLFTGIFLSVLYLGVLSLMSYVFYSVFLRSNNYWYKMAYLFWSLGLVMSFFANYYTLLNVWELTLYSLIAGFLTTRKFEWNGKLKFIYS